MDQLQLASKRNRQPQCQKDNPPKRPLHKRNEISGQMKAWERDHRVNEISGQVRAGKRGLLLLPSPKRRKEKERLSLGTSRFFLGRSSGQRNKWTGEGRGTRSTFASSLPTEAKEKNKGLYVHLASSSEEQRVLYIVKGGVYISAL
ncbi:hypothetical protein CHS0354_042792 [Potamilus streckersoni]|uniref:Uncharacterized protein n=1 Tax=Potamilus streckersoni TaxID=2493646 RepID=A0AAE0T4R4_9BIVA|nr:hypothetical protein CHS0354_042792 [Potamilus streckersoni]